MKEWTFNELERKTKGELETIKTEKMDSLYKLKQERLILISNIIQLQEMEKKERGLNPQSS